MPPSRFFLALALSLTLHGGLLLPSLLQSPNVAPARPPLQAVLRPQPQPEPSPVETLLKNTLDSEPAIQASPPPRPALPADRAGAKPAASVKREVVAAQKKLSQYLYYPPEAVARGIEGEVRLRIALDEAGSITDVLLVASSGYPMLDNAAIKAAWAMGQTSATPARQLLLPVIFRLQ